MPGAFADDFVPPPRVRAEGKNIYKQHQGTIQNIILEVEGRSLFDRPVSHHKKPKDHIFQNVKRMRQIQKACRARVEESESKEPEPVKALWRSAKYATVPSKVAQFVTTNYEVRRPASARPSVHTEQIKGAHHSTANHNGVSKTTVVRPHSARPSATDRPEIVPPLSDIADENTVYKPKRVPRNIIRDNAMSAFHAPLRRSPSAMTLQEAKQRTEDHFKEKHQPGQVPDYLRERKKKWEAEEVERIKNLPDPDQPPGHRLMPSNDRKATLEKLRSRERELTNQLLRMPLMVDTPRMIKHKNDIESQLSEVDEAIRVFSRQKVFVKCD